MAHPRYKTEIARTIIYIPDSRLNRLESVSLASLARQLKYILMLFLKKHILMSLHKYYINGIVKREKNSTRPFESLKSTFSETNNNDAYF